MSESVKLASSESGEQHLKMDRRKKRTSSSQYMMYIELMENDSIFATGRIPRDGDANYLTKKWKELSDKLNTCSSGPRLTAEEWRKRLNDWKNTTRCKYRRSLSGEKDISMTALEVKALDLFGKVPNVNIPPEHISIQLKSEKQDQDEENESQRTSESFQKELQAAVEEAIGDDDDDGMTDDDNEEILPDGRITTAQSTAATSTPSGGANYRTILVESTQLIDDGDHSNMDYSSQRQRRHTTTATAAAGVQTVVSTVPATTVTKLINGEVPLKRLRTQAPHDQIVYEVKKAPPSVQTHPPQLTQRNITIHNTAAPSNISTHQMTQQHTLEVAAVANALSSIDAREIGRQLKRVADIKAEKLKFEIARFKFNNPGFHFNYPQL